VFTSPVGLGIFLGLLIGKPCGILLFSWLANKAGLASLPDNIKWIHILGIGLLGGIGFTMSLFVSGLAFKGTELTDTTKISVLLASIIAGVAGHLVLRKLALKE
jgi:NhaA family Na+:H+ antiporter